MIHFVVGTRAQLLKLAPVMQECSSRGLAWRWIYTAQHKRTIDEILSFFDLEEPDYVMGHRGDEARSLGRMASWASSAVREIIRPRTALGGMTGTNHIVLTHGDTFSTVVGALLGKLTRTPVMHVESGLRSYRLFDPFPEELNRLATFALTEFYACPGPRALRNVARYRGRKIDTGANTQVDVLDYGLRNLHKSRLVPPAEAYAVVSVHRYENVYSRRRFGIIVDAIESAAERLHVVMPRHPVTESRLERLGWTGRLEANPRIRLLPRLPYEDYLKLIANAEFVMTDGGGNQEELSYLGVPTLVLRDRSEREEGLGENAVLSRLDQETMNEFFLSYERHRRATKTRSHRPSSLITDVIARYGGAEPAAASRANRESIAR